MVSERRFLTGDFSRKCPSLLFLGLIFKANCAALFEVFLRRISAHFSVFLGVIFARVSSKFTAFIYHILGKFGWIFSSDLSLNKYDFLSFLTVLFCICTPPSRRVSSLLKGGASKSVRRDRYLVCKRVGIFAFFKTLCFLAADDLKLNFAAEGNFWGNIHLYGGKFFAEYTPL